MPAKKKWVVDEKGYHVVTTWESAPSKSKEPVEDPANAAPVKQKEKPEIRLIKGTWISNDEELDFNKECIAKIEAKFLKETQKKKITLDAFVIFKDEEEELGQTKEVTLDNDGIGEATISLFYGEKYKEAIEKDPDDNLCHYIFRVKGENCLEDLESEKLEMPFLPPCVKERQKKKAEMNASGADGGSTCTDDCATCEKREECLQKTPCEYEAECTVSASCQENEGEEETSEGTPPDR
jgi:hypothetical protein